MLLGKQEHRNTGLRAVSVCLALSEVNKPLLRCYLWFPAAGGTSGKLFLTVPFPAGTVLIPHAELTVSWNCSYMRSEDNIDLGTVLNSGVIFAEGSAGVCLEQGACPLHS